MSTTEIAQRLAGIEKELKSTQRLNRELKDMLSTFLGKTETGAYIPAWADVRANTMDGAGKPYEEENIVGLTATVKGAEMSEFEAYTILKKQFEQPPIIKQLDDYTFRCFKSKEHRDNFNNINAPNSIKHNGKEHSRILVESDTRPGNTGESVGECERPEV
jgi:hypothetical protein